MNRPIDDAIRQAAAEGDETALEILALEGEDLQSAGPEPEPGETVTNGKRAKDTDKRISKERKRMENPILSKIGIPKFLAGDGRQYPRQTGWGQNKTKHPDGGTNETIAFLVFTPFETSNVTLEGRIYCQRYTEAGKEIEDYSVSLPFLKADRKDTASRDMIGQVQNTIRGLFEKWQMLPEAHVNPAKTAERAGRWIVTK